MASYTVPTHERVTDTVLGVVNENEKGTIKNPAHNHIWPATFDIDVIFGQNTGAGAPVHVVIEGVRLTNYSSAVSADGTGRPNIFEVYNFVGRDITTIE